MCLGIPGKIVELTSGDTAIVDVAGVRRSINISCVLSEYQSAQHLINQWVLVHVGFAMSLIDAEEARQTLTLLDTLGDLSNELVEMQLSANQLPKAITGD